MTDVLKSKCLCNNGLNNTGSGHNDKLSLKNKGLTNEVNTKESEICIFFTIEGLFDFDKHTALYWFYKQTEEVLFTLVRCYLFSDDLCFSVLLENILSYVVILLVQQNII